MIKISAPEVLLASSCVLLCTGNTFAGVVFCVMGALGATVRLAVENSVRQDQLKRERELYESIGRAGSLAFETLSSMAAAASHRDDSDYN